MTDDDRLDPALLAAYEVPEPASDLGDRFAARLVPPRRTPRWRYAAVGAVVIAAAVTIVVLGMQREPRTATGAANATARTSEKLGERGVAVVEPGGAITWEVSRRGAHIRQDRGDVFYRVERAAEPFEVTTSQAVVRVRGTCFRVVLESYGTTVSVDEGTVELANARGQILVAAGERAVATKDAPPRMLSLTAPPVVAASPAELVARDRAQRERIAELEQQIASSARTTDAIATPHHARKVFDLSHEELEELAKRCMVPHDIEPLAGSTVMDTIIEKGVKEIGMTDAERAALTRLIDKMQPAYEEGLRKLYTELTGEAGATLDPITLIMEITQKSPAADTSLAFQRLANERVAGGVSAIGDAKSAVIERYVRFMIANADAFEAQLADEIGRERARQFRRTWGGVNLAPGCPDTNH